MHDNKAYHSHAFSAAEGEDNDKGNKDKGKEKDGGAAFRGNKPKPKCLCGLWHYFMDCYYIRTDHPDKPPSWKLNEGKAKKIKEAIDNEPELKVKIDRAFERLRQPTDTAKSNLNKDNKDKKKDSTKDICVTAFKGSFAANSYLFTSWILDGGSGINICNDSMLYRFEKERECTDGSYVVAGEGPMPIIAYGKVKIPINTPNGKSNLIVSDVNYVPKFMTNVVLQHYLKVKGNLWIDPRRCRMERDGETIFIYTEKGAYLMLEDNLGGHGDVAQSSFAVTRQGTARDWHQLLAHAADDAIQHLPQATEGVKITDKEKVPTTNKCETCALSKAHQIISRSTFKSEDSDKQYHRDQLPREPKTWEEMLKHPMYEGFIAATQVELNDLTGKQTWKEVLFEHAKKAGKTPIPTTWVFKYKFDEQGYLLKLKARLCARGDLQSTAKDTYAAILAIRIFRCMMAITAYFGLETRQYDAVNAFANSDIDEPTYLYPPKG